MRPGLLDAADHPLAGPLQRKNIEAGKECRIETELQLFPVYLGIHRNGFVSPGSTNRLKNRIIFVTDKQSMNAVMKLQVESEAAAKVFLPEAMPRWLVERYHSPEVRAI